MTKLPYWPKPSDLVSALLPKNDRVVLSYELAPTGRVHAGIVRTLLYADSIRQEFKAAGCSTDFILRINDVAAEKSLKTDQNPNGAGIAARMRDRDNPEITAMERLQMDLGDTLAAFNIDVSRIERVSDIYLNPRFHSILEAIAHQAPRVRAILTRDISKEATLFHPVCANCSRLYGASLETGFAALSGSYRCRNCNFEGVFDARTSRGLLAFKVESAAMWSYLEADIDLHGQDHIEAYETSVKIAAQLSTRIAIPGRVNLTFNSMGEKVSKSRNNFVPVTELGRKRQDLLRTMILGTGWHLPLRLPNCFEKL